MNKEQSFLALFTKFSIHVTVNHIDLWKLQCIYCTYHKLELTKKKKKNTGGIQILNGLFFF